MRAFVYLLMAPVLFAADWIKVATPNFELYTSSSEKEAREILNKFEQTRDFFTRVHSTKQTSQLPVTLVVFEDKKQYLQYRDAITPAFFAGDEQRDYIVMSNLGEDRDLAATHEYSHVLVRHSGLNLPTWLDEGMADVYSTMKVADGKIVVGASSKWRTRSLIEDKWIPLPNILQADRGSPLYNEADRIGAFYGQSWLLAHMLMLSEEYSPKFPRFVASLAESGSSQKAFSDVYNKSVAQIQAAMNAYFRQSSIGAAGYQATLRSAEIGPARPATELEMGVTLAKLAAFSGRPDEAVQKLEQLAAAHPEQPELDEAIAYIAFKGGDSATAMRHFQAAFARGTANWKTYWDYARLLLKEETDRRGRVAALRKALDGNPDLLDARLLLGIDLYSGGDLLGSLEELQKIKTIGPAADGRLFATMAAVAARLDRNTEARGYAAEAKKHRLSADERTAVEKLESLLSQTSSATDNTAHPEDEVPTRPQLRRAAPPKPAAPAKSTRK